MDEKPTSSKEGTIKSKADGENPFNQTGGRFMDRTQKMSKTFNTPSQNELQKQRDSSLRYKQNRDDDDEVVEESDKYSSDEYQQDQFAD